MKKTIAFSMAILTASLIAGCQDQSRPADLPTLFPCAILITQDGKPLDGAVVELVPVDAANAKYRASSATDADGKAVLTTYGFDGVPAGRYKVCVWKTVVEGVKQFTNADGETVNTNGVDYQTVEPQYSSAETTPHEINIADKKTPLISFDVGKPIKVKK
ncbi:MAG: carboxypeptidase-like regulatory domain-containing protein [Planctomycetaceae bacterium]|jgi:hypothetical protein|nr:carboxypeptidase-like regulatory domain-containing protein [Planctomycetaceae bacterium]